MDKKLIVGNWKMYTTAIEAKELAKSVVEGIGIENSLTVVICPPFPYLDMVGEILQGSRIKLGAQNLFPEKEGAFTGEVSPTMLLDLGCKYVILGHSERRHKLGETLHQRESDQTEALLHQQLLQGLADLPAGSLSRLSIAYEPVWAIGNHGHHATPRQAQDAHDIVRRCFGQMFEEKSAQTLAIIYGGSVNPEDAAALLGQQGVDGVLVGADSLNADQFLSIIKAGVAKSPKGLQQARTIKENTERLAE